MPDTELLPSPYDPVIVGNTVVAALAVAEEELALTEHDPFCAVAK